MSKLLKSFLIASLVVCMTVCLGLFAAACNNDPDPEDSNGYVTVTVVLPDDDQTPVKGVEVSVCTMNGTLMCLEAVNTDENGSVKVDVSDYSDSTKFLVKLHNLPDGYIYADENGVEYGSEEGIVFDAEALNTKSFKVVLTAVVDEDDGVDDGDNNGDNNGDNDDNNNNEEEDVTITVVSLNTPVDFNMTLCEVPGFRGEPDTIQWGEKDENGYVEESGRFLASFTTSTAGSYKISVTSELEGEELNCQVYAGYTYPDCEKSNYLNYWVYSLKANTTYTIQINSAVDYTEYNKAENDTLRYTFKLETYDPDEDQDDEEESESLSTGTTTLTGALGTYYFEGETLVAGKSYNITITTEEDDFVWKINDNTIETNSTVITTDTMTSYVEIYISGACTITITEVSD